MKNTQENKGRFFALYWGCETTFTGQGRPVKSVQKNAKVNADTFSFLVFSSQRALSLKSLSDISDLDLSELAQETETTIGSDPEMDQFLSLYGFRENLIANIFAYSGGVFDYLRSKSYLLPFGDITVEEILQFGWAKV